MRYWILLSVTCASFVGCLIFGSRPLYASEPASADVSVEDAAFFATKVQPLLKARCTKCHGAEKQSGDLRLDARAAILAGGESGPAVEPGKPDESLLVEAINYDSYEMPPKGKLPPGEIDILTEWIKRGAPWGGDAPEVVLQPKKLKITDEDRTWWSFQPVVDHAVPQLKDDNDWPKNEIDHFILDRLGEEKLSPAPQADKTVLIRRVYFDLLGVPPTPEEVKAFAEDQTPDAYVRLVDRLLNDSRYGERFARHWLDLVRYAESDGYKADGYRPEAWRYRDYVIKSLNADKPYNQFVAEQIAGDEIAPGDRDALTATMYLRHGMYEYNQRDVKSQWAHILNEITDTTGDVFLGMGMACARCHDHKFDPILQKDYFRLQAFFTPLQWREDVPIATIEQHAVHHAEQAKWNAATGEIRRELDAIERPILLNTSSGQGFDKFTSDLKAMMRKLPEDRTPREHQLAELAQRQLSFHPDKLEEKLGGEQKLRWQMLKDQLAKHAAKQPKALPTMRFGVTDVGRQGPATFIADKERLGPVEPGYLSVLDEEAAKLADIPDELDSTGRRTTLAQWIGRDDNPLSTRVIVNRVWAWHFGRGLVATTSDFGHLGEKPSHPELLDWLTKRFIEEGWKLKPLHRRILLSSTYQQAALSDSSLGVQVDPQNRLLWKQNIRRLDAEQIRDAMLAVTGELDTKLGGPSVAASAPRRSVYMRVERNKRDSLMAAFDAPDGLASASDRDTTTTATQALLLINGKYTLERAKRLARRIESEKMASDKEVIDKLWRLAFGRSPELGELEAGLEFLQTGPTNQAKPKPQPPTVLATAKFPQQGDAIDVTPSHQGKPALANHASLPEGDFSVEAFVLLRSLSEDASVRTIVSHWSSDTSQPGWAFGVTSKKSRYTPRNLIMQLVGRNKDGKQTYEVIPSGILLDLNQPYYVAATVDIDNTGKSGITFYVKKLDDKSTLQTANVAHQVVKDYRPTLPLLLGGRPKHTRHNWDGLIAEVRLTGRVLKAENLLVGPHSAAAEGVIGRWNFESTENRLADNSAAQHHLQLSAPMTSQTVVESTPLIDLCHVLLNCNEFLYVE